MATIKRAASKADKFTIEQNDGGGADALKQMQDQSDPQSKLLTEYVPVDSLKPDPDNPRKLGMSMELLTTPPEKVADEGRRQMLESVISLAKAIASEGLSNPIEVYRLGTGGTLRIISGERRFWACMYNLQTAKTAQERLRHHLVRVTLYREKPTRLRAKQLGENALRESLSLADQMASVTLAHKEFVELAASSKQHKAPSNAMEFAEATHLPYHDAKVWWRVLHERAQIRPLISEGHLSALGQVSHILTLSTAQFTALVKEIREKGFSWTLLESIKRGDIPVMPAPQEPAPGSVKRRVGRPQSGLVPVKVNPQAVRRMAEAVAKQVSLELPGDLDWSKPKTVKVVLEKLLAAFGD